MVHPACMSASESRAAGRLSAGSVFPVSLAQRERVPDQNCDLLIMHGTLAFFRKKGLVESCGKPPATFYRTMIGLFSHFL